MRRRLLVAIAVCVSVAAVTDAENTDDLFVGDLTDLIAKGTVAESRRRRRTWNVNLATRVTIEIHCRGYRRVCYDVVHKGD